MEKWEEIIKQNLKDSKVSLPEDDFALFQEKLAKTNVSEQSKKAVIIPFSKIAKFAAPALAACAAAAFIFLHTGGGGEGSVDPLEHSSDIIQKVQQENMLADALDSDMDLEEFEIVDAIENKVSPRKDSPKSSTRVSSSVDKGGNTDSSSVESKSEDLPSVDESSDLGNQNPSTSSISETVQQQEEVNKIINGESSNDSYYGLGGYEPIVRDRKHGKVGKAIAGVSGGTLAGFLASAVSAAGGILPKSFDAYVPELDTPGVVFMGSNNNMATTSEVNSLYRHVIPMKAGLTARYPITPKLYLMSGLEYSIYYSSIDHVGLPSTKQFAHYLGVPLRLDWNFASAKKFDFYLGGGGALDFCLSATRGSEKIGKDKLAFSVVGATGVQYNFCKVMGLYLEPQVCWSPFAKDGKLSTYRSTHPVLLSGAIGLRFNL